MALEEVTHCPICESSTFSHRYICQDFTATGELFHVKQCSGCELLITSPRPTVHDAARYYKSDKYISHTAVSSGIFDSIYLIVRRFTLKWKFRLVKPYLHGNPLLDYGCGTGNFLEQARSNNIIVHGVEPSPDARKRISTTLPVAASLDLLPNIKFDVITAWHVLEHVYTLRETLRQIKDRLTDRGTIFIAVPNWESSDANHYKELWAAYDVPRHLWHFSKKSMIALLQNEGLAVKQIIPMKLDAYYVSMLSQKNGSPGTHSLPLILKAVWVGLLSNLRGGNQNQSSMIFVVQK